MRTWTKETLQILRLNIKNIIIFELLYRLFTVPVYLRLLKLCLRFSLRQAGYSYLTLENIGRFVLKPWTLICILIVAFVGMFFLILEVAGLITAYQGSAYTRKLTPLSIFAGGLDKLRGRPLKRNIRLLFVALVHYMVINQVFLARMFTHIKPFNFIIQEIGTKPLFLVCTGMLALVIALAAAFTMFVLYGCMIEQKTFRDSCVRSRQLMQGNVIRTVLHLVLCHVCLVAGIVLLYYLCAFLAAVFIVLFTRQNLALAVLTETCSRIEVILIFVASIASVIVHFGALTMFYYQHSRKLSHEVRWDFSYPGMPAARTNGRQVLAGAVLGIGMISCVYIFDLVRNGALIAGEIWYEIQITAHRGSSREAPENTMAAIVAAVEDLADYAEIDVQLSSDGVVVLGHDANLKRVAGVNRSISSMTWEELQRLDVGVWFSNRYEGETVPALEDILEYCKGKIKLNIEIKSVGKDSPLPEQVAGMIRANNMAEQCVITSTSLNYLRKVKQAMPELHTGYIISAAYGNFYSDEAVDFISIRSNFVDEALVKNAHEQGCAVHAWTVNKRSEMERMRMLGVDNIITDYPAVARETLYQEETKESLLEYLRMVLLGV